MAAVLVTVVGPAGRLDLEMPAEVPIVALLDALVRMLGGTEGAAPAGDWSLSPSGGDPLPATAPLAAAGVRDGAVLVLSDEHQPRSPPRSGRRAAVIGVLSANAGMGRTTVAALLAGALAAGTGRRTVAVEVDSGAGSLGDRLAPGHDLTAADLLGLIDHPALTRDELLAFLAWCSPGLWLLADRAHRDRGPPVEPLIGERDWTRLLDGLARHGLVQVADCPPGLGDQGTSAILATADQVVLVVEPDPSAPSRRMASSLADRGLPVVAIPWHIPSAPGGAGRVGELGEGVWRVAEVLVAEWVGLGVGVGAGWQMRRPGPSNGLPTGGG
jgi:hypothetical protein